MLPIISGNDMTIMADNKMKRPGNSHGAKAKGDRCIFPGYRG
jgi:hypothetical protein